MAYNLPTLNATDLVEVIRAALQAKVSVMVYGPPGVGKTTVLRKAASLVGFSDEQVITVNMPQLDSVDLRGVPYVEKLEAGASTHWAAPWFMGIGQSARYIILDEITSAMPSVAVSGMQLFLEHRIGDAVLPEGSIVVAAGNTADDNTIAYELAAPARNRVFQCQLAVDVGLWLDWAKDKKLDPKVISFITANPIFLSGKIKVLDTSFASPRSWELLSRIMQSKLPINLLRPLAEGLIGTEATTFFMTHLASGKKASLTPAQIRATPKTISLPEPGELGQVLESLAATATSKTMMQDIAFLSRLSDEAKQTFISKLGQPLARDYSEWLKVAK